MNAIAYYNKGVLAEDRGDEATALEYYLKAVDCDASIVQAHFNIAQIMLRNNNDMVAKEALEYVLRFAPDDTEARLQIVGVYHRLGELEAAKKELHRAYGEVKQQWSRGGGKAILSLLVDLEKRVQNNGFVYLMLGNAYRESGEFTKSLEFLRKAKKLLPLRSVKTEIELAEGELDIHVVYQEPGETTSQVLLRIK